MDNLDKILSARGWQTQLSPQDEIKFLLDKKLSRFANDPSYDYDLRGYWLNNNKSFDTKDKRGHLNDTYKTPLHNTFSIGSLYYNGQPYAINWDSDYGRFLEALGY